MTFSRSKGHRVVTFLDDGLGRNQNYNTACASSEFVRQSLIEFGFLISEEKYQWQPALQVSWLGCFFCMKTGRFFVNAERVERIEMSIKGMIGQLQTQQYQIVPAKFAASVVGQIMSTQSVIGKIVILKTRELYKCIDSRLSCYSPVYISEKAMNELNFWLSNLKSLNRKGQSIKESTAFEVALFADASGDGYGGYIELERLMSSKPVSARNAGLQKQSVFPEVEVQRSIQKERSDINETASLGRKSNSFKAVKVRENMLDTSHGVSLEVETISSPKVETGSSPEVENGLTSRAVTPLQEVHKCRKDFLEAESSMNIRSEGSLFLKVQNFSDEHLHGHKSMNKYKSPVSDENTIKVRGSNYKWRDVFHKNQR